MHWVDSILSSPCGGRTGLVETIEKRIIGLPLMTSQLRVRSGFCRGGGGGGDGINNWRVN